ncbi:MAG: GIY-YIG nuclease family protein [Deferribacterales bacterium]
MNDMAKKSLKEQFKKRKPIAGIFCIETKYGLCFTGFGTDVESLLNRHRTELNFGSHRNKELQNEWNLEKGKSFRFGIVEELKVRENSSIEIKEELKVLLNICISEMTKEGKTVRCI